MYSATIIKLLAFLIFCSAAVHGLKKEEKCNKVVDCIRCTQEGCIWYANMNSGFCGDRGVHPKLFVHKARTPSSCFRVWSESSQPTDSESNLGSSRLPLLLPTDAFNASAPAAYPVTEKEPRKQVSLDSRRSEIPATAAGKVDDDLLALNCKIYVNVQQKIKADIRDPIRLFRRCERALGKTVAQVPV